MCLDARCLQWLARRLRTHLVSAGARERSDNCSVLFGRAVRSSLLLLSALAACWGVVRADGASRTDTALASATWQTCATVPTPMTYEQRTVAREFGAVPDDDVDDGPALQRALDALERGQALRLEPGRYLMSRSLQLQRRGTALIGDRSVLHATEPDDQALLVRADDATVASLTLTAVTSGRRNAARHSRIAVVADEPGGYRTVRNTVIRDNRIVADGAPGSALGASASAAAILLLRAENFLVAGNVVERSLADGIHVTGGSRGGRVLDNTVRDTGDDMIAVVSYADSGDAAANHAGALLDTWQRRQDERLVQGVLIADNRLSGAHWGRGIAVVGGRGITIARNTLERMPRAAAILLAREANYQTFGVEDVLVENNAIREVQTDAAAAAASGGAIERTGHGAVELHAALFDDEAAHDLLRQGLAVRNVRLRANTVSAADVSAVRVGVDMSQTLVGTSADGRAVTRAVRSGTIEGLAFEDNRFDSVAAPPIDVLQASAIGAAGLHCSANHRDGSAYSVAGCAGAAPVVQGAAIQCAPDGSTAGSSR
jgi:hypothetical protein